MPTPTSGSTPCQSRIVTRYTIAAPTKVPTNGMTVRAPTRRPIGTARWIPTIEKPTA